MTDEELLLVVRDAVTKATDELLAKAKDRGEPFYGIAAVAVSTFGVHLTKEIGDHITRNRK